MTHESWLEGLNDAQLTAVTAPMGHLLVLAGAGSGKTRVLVSRIAHLVHSGQISVGGILAVTFTNKAAGEMKARLGSILHQSMSDLWIGTFHGICHRLLRRHHELAKLPVGFQILDSDDQARMIKRVIAFLQLDSDQWPVKQAQAFINNNKDQGLRAHQVVTPSFGPAKTWVMVYQAYEQACQIAGVIDFAEILLRAYELLQQNPELLAHYHARFQTILVDEFQDTNTLQYAWIRLLAGPGIAVMVVGDDDQSIYGWRGAKIENIQRFSRDFPDTLTVRLEQNYRSSAIILQAANALIENNQGRMGKSLWTSGLPGDKIIVFSAFNELEEARFVAERVALARQQGRALCDIAVLYRSNAQSRVFEEAFLRAGIAYRIHGGMRFFERAEIKDTLAYLRLLVNQDDDAAFERVVNLPARGIGEKTLEMLRQAARAESIPLWAAANTAVLAGQLPQRATQALRTFLNMILAMQETLKDLPLDEQVHRVVQDSGLYAHYAKLKADSAESKLQNLQELVSAAKEFRYDQADELPLLVSFLAHASLEAGEWQAAEHEDYVQMMTLHAAKGLEFPLVFLAGMEEGVFPAKRSVDEPGRLEEERRLCYVGMTRAMQQLVMSYAEVRRQYGREEYHRPSRFMNELPRTLLDELRHSRQPVATKTPKFSQVEHESGFHLGQAVTHATFGQGVILAIEGSGAHTRVQINFAEQGTKWLVVAYANLQQA
ncbi:MAG: DNA helicase II [Gammaproteobacteria bacterium]|nr:DNA helicase II [Gammaproteobacteria bacterium]